MSSISVHQVREAQMRDRYLALKHKAQETMQEAIECAEIVGAGAAMGWVRGKMEQSDGSWVIPGTTIDIELASGLGLIGASFFDLFGKYDKDVLAAGSGTLAHYFGQVFRKYGKSGTFALIAGDRPVNLVGARSPANDLAAALAQSGI